MEALVLAGGKVSHLSRVPATTSGWSYTVLTGGNDIELIEVTDLAVSTAADGSVYAPILLDISIEDYDGPGFIWATLGTSGDWQYTTTAYPFIDEGDKLNSLRAGTDQKGNPYFYAFYTSSDEGNNGVFLLWQNTESLDYAVYDSLKGQDVRDAQHLFNSSWSQENQAGGAWRLDSQQTATSTCRPQVRPSWPRGQW